MVNESPEHFNADACLHHNLLAIATVSIYVVLHGQCVSTFHDFYYASCAKQDFQFMMESMQYSCMGDNYVESTVICSFFTRLANSETFSTSLESSVVYFMFDVIKGIQLS